MTPDMHDTAITTKAASIPISVEMAKIFGLPITDVGTYLSIFIGCLVIIDYMWKWYRRYTTPRYTKDQLDFLDKLERD